MKDPKSALALDYTHPDLVGQLNHGVRQIEIDIYADSRGGAYANPRGAQWERQAGIAPHPDDIHPKGMSGTDFKVMHIIDLDQRANCEPLRACLAELHDWSLAHPNHLPIFVDIETKQAAPSLKIPFSKPERFTPETYDRLDNEIRDVISIKNLIVPDQVRGSFFTLNEAIHHNEWPSVENARGKFVFLLDRPADTARYTVGHPSLRGRVMFTNSTPGAPEAAFTELNDDDARAHAETEKKIADLVRDGYLVRTRADANTVEARADDVSRRDTALRSGAQLVTTDYPASEPAKWNGYHVALPDNVIARCNPVNRKTGCEPSELTEGPQDGSK